MSRAWNDETEVLSHADWYREDKPTLAEQALHARIARDRSIKVAGWLACAVLAVVLVILIAVAVFAWHAGGSLNGGG